MSGSNLLTVNAKQYRTITAIDTTVYSSDSCCMEGRGQSMHIYQHKSASVNLKCAQKGKENRLNYCKTHKHVIRNNADFIALNSIF